jgi:large subunit ribosomal protein L6
VSRIGKQPVAILKGVELKKDGNKVSIKGPKGALSVEVPKCLNVDVADGKLTLSVNGEVTGDVKAQWGLHRALINNMVQGVSAGYRKSLEIVGVGYKAEMVGKNLKVVVGLSHPVTIQPSAGIALAIEGPTKIVIDGADKQMVGQVAAAIRSIRPPEPYKGKGIRYSGEKVRQKAGKAAVK